jgi:hypothetical protein
MDGSPIALVFYPHVVSHDSGRIPGTTSQMRWFSGFPVHTMGLALAFLVPSRIVAMTTRVAAAIGPDVAGGATRLRTRTENETTTDDARCKQKGSKHFAIVAPRPALLKSARVGTDTPVCSCREKPQCGELNYDFHSPPRRCQR